MIVKLRLSMCNNSLFALHYLPWFITLYWIPRLIYIALKAIWHIRFMNSIYHTGLIEFYVPRRIYPIELHIPHTDYWTPYSTQDLLNFICHTGLRGVWELAHAAAGGGEARALRWSRRGFAVSVSLRVSSWCAQEEVTVSAALQVLDCVACNKSFKSEAQWKNHEQSSKHKQVAWVFFFPKISTVLFLPSSELT